MWHFFETISSHPVIHGLQNSSTNAEAFITLLLSFLLPQSPSVPHLSPETVDSWPLSFCFCPSPIFLKAQLRLSYQLQQRQTVSSTQLLCAPHCERTLSRQCDIIDPGHPHPEPLTKSSCLVHSFPSCIFDT